jgi:putative endonuclease
MRRKNAMLEGLWNRLLSSLGVDRSVGRRGERIAAGYLRKHRYRILARNLRVGRGEIDILAQAPDAKTIVIVEVKSGCGDGPRPEVHVNLAKERKLAAMASLLSRNPALRQRPVRFDVIGVQWPDESVSGRPSVRHHVGAFESYL